MPNLYDAVTYTNCPVCLKKTRQGIILLPNNQEFWCEDGKHVIVYDKKGKEIVRVEKPQDPNDWRASIDRQREEGYVPQKKAWEPELDGKQRQRRVRAGKNNQWKYNFYADPDKPEGK